MIRNPKFNMNNPASPVIHTPEPTPVKAIAPVGAVTVPAVSLEGVGVAAAAVHVGAVVGVVLGKIGGATPGPVTGVVVGRVVVVVLVVVVVVVVLVVVVAEGNGATALWPVVPTTANGQGPPAAGCEALAGPTQAATPKLETSRRARIEPTRERATIHRIEEPPSR